MKIIKNEKWVELMEGVGVVMRIIAFGTLSIMGPNTPFLLMWIWNTIDAVIPVSYTHLRAHETN
jgi:hypothetical protein